MTARGADVLLIAFVRPDLLDEALDGLRRGPVRRVFLALDGPRPDRPGDAAAIDACEALVRSAFAGVVPVEVLRRDTNLGMKRSCTSAIDWFLARVGEGIIIEEDCVVDPSFLRFAGELLHRYRTDERVMGICGGLPSGAPGIPDASYGFVRNFGVWGWATWERAWRHNDPDLAGVSDAEIDAVLRRQPDTSTTFRRFWAHLIRACRDGRDPNWDFPWTYSAWRNGGLFIRPDRNLVSNIGHDERAAQTTAPDPRLSRVPTAPMTFPLRHPPEITHDAAFDRWSDRHVKGIGWSLVTKRALLHVAPWIRRRREP